MDLEKEGPERKLERGPHKGTRQKYFF